jgi:hypothetical protein
MLATLAAVSGLSGALAAGELKAAASIAATVFSTSGLAVIVNNKLARKAMQTLMDPPVRGWGVPQFTRAMVQLQAKVARQSQGEQPQ